MAQLAVGSVQHGQAHRHLGEAVDHLADDVGALVAEEQELSTWIWKLARSRHSPQAHAALHASSTRRRRAQVLELALQLEVVDDAQQRLVQASRAWGSRRGRSARRRLVVLDVLGADRRPHEDEVVAEVAAVQQLGGDRVEEGLGQLGLVVVGQQADVVQLDLLPAVHRQVVDVELAAQPVHGLVHALVVVLDALALGALLAVPVGVLEALLGAAALASRNRR
jgi:hypothetical protein